jgi:DNA-binding transcriptional MerR regulator
MFTIGDFATFTAVSVPALRLWDRLGLLTPAQVDSRTGYRRYRAEQAIVVQRIVALKALGFTLAQIGPLLHTVPSRDELRGMLALRRAEAEAEQQRASERLAAIEARLLILERSSLMNHPHDVVRKTAPAVRLAAIDRHLDASDESPDRLFAAFGELFGDLAARLAAARVTPIGPAWSLYERSDETGLVIRAALPVAVATMDAPVRILDRPELSVASTMHTGDVQHMGVAYAAVMEWMEANSLVPAGGAAEISLVWDPDNPEANVTELQLPIAPPTETED